MSWKTKLYHTCFPCSIVFPMDAIKMKRKIYKQSTMADMKSTWY